MSGVAPSKRREEAYWDIIPSTLNLIGSSQLTLQYGFTNLAKKLQPWGPPVLANLPFIMLAMQALAFYGHIKILKYIPLGYIGNFIPYIQTATEQRHYDVVKFLISYINVEQYRDDIVYWIQLSAQNGDIKSIKLFHSLIPDLSLNDPLIWAIEVGKFRMVKYLVEQGADVNPNLDEDLYPIREAIDKGELKILKYLLSKGASLTEPINYLNSNEMEISVLTENVSMVKFLIEAGAQIKDELLNIAIGNYDLDMVKILMSYGLEIDRHDIFDDYNLSEVGAIETLDYVLQKWPNINVDTEDSDLITAIQHGSVHVVKYMLKKITYLNYEALKRVTITDPLILNMLNQKLTQQYALFEQAIREERIDIVKDFLDKHIYIDFEWLKRIPITNPIIINMLNQALQMQHFVNMTQNVGIQ
jgi:ankyrin repeat protein